MMLPGMGALKGPQALCIINTFLLIVYLSYVKAPRLLQCAATGAYAASWLFYFLDPEGLVAFSVIQGILGLYLGGHVLYRLLCD
ncbi:MAG: hypothetical protein FJ290_03975 [Planctomycetes bacterium]|nr:hypothetical protein [Planctomycetota bacterium]